MRKIVVGFGALVALFLALPLASAADPKKDNKKPDAKDAGATLDSDKLPAGKFSGKLSSVPSTDGKFHVAIEYQHVEMTQQGQQAVKNNPQNQNLQQLYRQQQQIAQAQQQLANARSREQQMQPYQHLQQAVANLQRQMTQAQMHPNQNQQSPFKVVTDHKDVEFQVSDTVQVRTELLPSVYDEKGEVKKYTDEEKKQLKGKRTDLPGYEGKIDDLKVGQLVTVTLGAAPAPKPAAKPEAKPADAKEADKDADTATAKPGVNKDKDSVKPDANNEQAKKKQVSLILITKDADTPEPNKGKQPKKKN